mmetsp:Transcript_19373/g.37289  ORF Transcript_19373/g.37289 Transcript_19373/m.37289 type:complete len:94 (-) Transcript_19373:481-762(-)
MLPHGVTAVKCGPKKLRVSGIAEECKIQDERIAQKSGSQVRPTEGFGLLSSAHDKCYRSISVLVPLRSLREAAKSSWSKLHHKDGCSGLPQAS